MFLRWQKKMLQYEYYIFSGKDSSDMLIAICVDKYESLRFSLILPA